MCGFIAQLVEHRISRIFLYCIAIVFFHLRWSNKGHYYYYYRTGIAEVTGSNPVQAMIFFFQSSYFQLFKLENLLR